MGKSLLVRPLKFYSPRGRNGKLANYHPLPRGTLPARMQLTAEHIYQALKYADSRLTIWRVMSMPSPAKAKEFAARHRFRRPDVSVRLKLEIMALVLMVRSYVDSEFERALRTTGMRRIVEWTPDDLFWGAHHNGGANWMGVLLVNERSRVRRGRRSLWPRKLRLSVGERRYLRRAIKWLILTHEIPASRGLQLAYSL